MNLEITNLNFKYEDKVVLNNYSIQLDSYKKIWLKGRSGIGKSTFLKIIAGMIEFQSGDVCWGENQFSKFNQSQKDLFRKNKIAYVNQENHLIENWTVENNLVLVLNDQQLQAAKKYFTRFNFIEKDLQKKVQYLSGGEKQKLNLLMSLFQGKEIYLFDEPTAHLDNDSIKIFFEILLNQNATSIIVSHDERLKDFINDVVEFIKK